MRSPAGQCAQPASHGQRKPVARQVDPLPEFLRPCFDFAPLIVIPAKLVPPRRHDSREIHSD